MKQTVVFDFDGVIHSYTSGWQGPTTISDPPVLGVREAIAGIRSAGYEVVVVSTRCATLDGLNAIKGYLDRYDIVVDNIQMEKPPAMVYIDDRAICFDGNPSTLLNKIMAFKPWNKSNTIINLKIENAFTYHAPKEGQPEKYQAIREKAKELAYLIQDLVPDSREKSLAMTKLEECTMWANAGIARN